MNERAKRISRLISALVTGGLVLAILVVFRSVPARAWNTTGGEVPSPCDFTTGGGFILIAPGTAFNLAGLPESGQKANFGLVGGCKNGGFFGHVNYVDHNNGLHVRGRLTPSSNRPRRPKTSLESSYEPSTTPPPSTLYRRAVWRAIAQRVTSPPAAA